MIMNIRMFKIQNFQILKSGMWYEVKLTTFCIFNRCSFQEVVHYAVENQDRSYQRGSIILHQ